MAVAAVVGLTLVLAVGAAPSGVRVVLVGGGTTAVVGAPWRATLVVRPRTAGVPRVTLRGPHTRPATVRRVAPGRYRVSARFDAAGRWRIEARVRGQRFVVRTVVARNAGPAPILVRGGVQVLLDGAGRLVVSENDRDRIERVDPATGKVTLVASLPSPYGIGLAPDGSLYATSDDQLFRIGSDGQRSVVARTQSGRDIGPVTIDERGNVFFLTDGTIYRLATDSGAITTYGGTGSEGFGGDGETVDQATFGRPHGLAIARDGALLVADSENGRIRRIDPATRVVTTVAAGLGFPAGIAVAPDGAIYVAAAEQHSVYRVTPGGAPTRVAGTGASGVSGDGGPAAAAALATPTCVAVAGDGTVYVVEYGSGHIRRIDPAGTITTLTAP